MSKDIEQYFSDNPQSLESFSKLNQALRDISLQMLEDRGFLADAFKQIQNMKREFGRGFLFLNLGQFNIEGNKITAPEADQLDTVWLDEATTRSNFKKQIADQILGLVDYKACPPKDEIFIFMGTVDNGEEVKEGRFSIVLHSAYVSPVLKSSSSTSRGNKHSLKPSSITDNQIRKRLKRIVQNNQRLLILDTSHPDAMGRNLAKWLIEINLLYQNNRNVNFNVIVDSSDEFPAEIPPNLRDDFFTLRFGK